MPVRIVQAPFMLLLREFDGNCQRFCGIQTLEFGNVLSVDCADTFKVITLDECIAEIRFLPSVGRDEVQIGMRPTLVFLR